VRKYLSLLFIIVISVIAAPVEALNPQFFVANGVRVDTDPYSLINEVNALRAAHGLPAYSPSPILMAVAQQHAQYMASAGVTHSGPGGSSPWQRGLAAGYPLAGDLSLGGFYSENIIAGNGMSVQEAVSAWQGDAPHLNTMLSPSLREIGAGVALVGNYAYYVIDCAAPTNSGQPQVFTPAPGGVVTGGTPAAPLVFNTLVPVTPLTDGKLVHVVKPGETLWLIAVSYGVKIADLRKLNNMTEAQAIFPGEKLYLGQAATASPVPATATLTLQATGTRPATQTPLPSPFPTSLPLRAATLSSSSSLLVLGMIVLAALILAIVFVRSARKVKYDQ